MKTSLGLASLLVSMGALYLAPGTGASPQVAVCHCEPQMFLSAEMTDCSCPDIAVSNLVTRIGRCNGLPGSCGNTSLIDCKVSGTATEINCESGVTGWSEPFSVTACCKRLPPGCEQNAQYFPCTNGEPGDCPSKFCHGVALDCGDCH
jgi:hypothetical protein